MSKLNRMLRADRGLKTKPCDAFSLEELQELQGELFAARSPTLQDMYSGDRRSLPYATNAALAGSHSEQSAWLKARPDLLAMLRDGLCHELVMMYMHHLSDSAREEVKSGAVVLPLLPEGDLH